MNMTFVYTDRGRTKGRRHADVRIISLSLHEVIDDYLLTFTGRVCEIANASDTMRGYY